MEITCIGHSAFKIKSRHASVITDPYYPDAVGIKFPKAEADIVTISHNHRDHNNTEAIGGIPIIINGPGEYEVKGVKIIGIPSYHDDSRGEKRGTNVIYRIEMDGLSIVHLGDLGHKLDDKDIELLDGIDILLIPVGGFYTINAQQASEIISKLEPEIVIPMHYRKAGMDEKVFGQVDALNVFLKEMGKENISPIPKLSVTKDKLPAELTVVILD